MKFSIIIPVRDDPRVREVVASLVKELPPDAEILVADDGVAGSLLPLAGARILPVHSGNPGNARNQAARIARGEILLFLDADVVVPSGWIERARSIFADAGVLAAQGYSEAVGPGALARRMQEEYDRFVASHDTTGHADLCDTRCFGIRREVFESYPFDVEEPYCEDSALGRRLFEAGIRIRFIPEWRIGHHYTRSAIGELSRLRRYAAASEAHLQRTGRDLFRAPGGEPPRGPGASLLRALARRPGPVSGGPCGRPSLLAPPVAAILWVLALAIGAGAGLLPGALGRRLFSRARRAAVLSERISGPGKASVGQLRAALLRAGMPQK